MGLGHVRPVRRRPTHTAGLEDDEVVSHARKMETTTGAKRRWPQANYTDFTDYYGVIDMEVLTCWVILCIIRIL